MKGIAAKIGIGLALFLGLVIVVLVLIDGSYLPGKYLEPWEKSYPEKFKDPRLQVVAYGLLAPSAHNRQSWRIRLDKKYPDVFFLYVDARRLLPISDPYSRQVSMSQGTFLESASIGAGKLGFELDIQYFPLGEYDARGSGKSLEAHPVARVRLVKSAPKKHPLHDALSGATNKTKLPNVPLENRAQNALLALNKDPDLIVRIYAGKKEREKIRDWTIRAMKIDLGVTILPKGGGETELFRFTERQKNKFRDGLTFAPFGFPGPRKFLMQSLGSVLPMSVEAMREMGLESFRNNVNDTPAYLMILSRGNTRLVQVKAGRLYARLKYVASGMGLTLQPAEQTLQEYPAMAKLYREFHETYAGPGLTIQMLAGMGKPTVRTEHGPRRDARDLVSQ